MGYYERVEMNLIRRWMKRKEEIVKKQEEENKRIEEFIKRCVRNTRDPILK